MILSDDTLIELYNNGNSCAEIAALNKCSTTKIYYKLKHLNVIIRDRSEANKIFPDIIFITLYNLGLSASQIGRLLGVNSSTVTKRLHTLEFPLRPRNVAAAIRYTEEEFVQNFMSLQFMQYIINLLGGK